MSEINSGRLEEKPIPRNCKTMVLGILSHNFSEIGVWSPPPLMFFLWGSVLKSRGVVSRSWD
jgi:hypothetical protein